MNTSKLYKIVQRFDNTKIEDISASVKTQCGIFADRVKPGNTIAITGGSRGIANIAEVIKAVASWVKEQGAHPFLIPAMGSHGGGVAEGQQEILEGYGMTEKYVGAPIKATMEVEQIPASDIKLPVYMDKYAYEADGVILVNRVKPHTDFRGKYESGLVKMSVIGLGKHTQALAVHRFGVHGLRDLIPQVARKIFESGHVIGGIALIENGYDETAEIHGVPVEKILDEEPALLERAYSLMPSLPVEDIDLLIMDEMGKDISGSGFDTNIVGREYIRGEAEPESPRIKTIMVRDLTDASHGNAVGLGVADVITRRLFDKIDFTTMNPNAYTSSFLERVKIPMVADNDAQAMEFALRYCYIPDGTPERIVRIKNTLKLDEVYVSRPVLEEVKGRSDITITGEEIEVATGGSCPSM